MPKQIATVGEQAGLSQRDVLHDLQTIDEFRNLSRDDSRGRDSVNKYRGQIRLDLQRALSDLLDTVEAFPVPKGRG